MNYLGHIQGYTRTCPAEMPAFRIHVRFSFTVPISSSTASVPVSLCPESKVSFDDVPHTWYHTFRYKITILTAWQVHPKSWNRLDGPPERRIHIDPIQCDFGT